MSPRTRRTIGVAVLVVATALGAAALRPWGGRRPLGAGGLVVDRSAFDFGTMNQDEAGSRRHSFVLTNTGDRPVRVTKVTASCGCTSAAAPADPVAPGASVEMPVSANWQGRAGMQAATVTVQTDSPVTPKLELAVSGLVTVPAVAFPGELNFGLLGPGERASRLVKVSQGTESVPFVITGLQNDSPYVTVHRAATADGAGAAAGRAVAGGPGEFLVEIVAPAEAARHEVKLVFTTDLPSCPQLPVVVRAEFQGALAATPPAVFFAENSIKQEVTVRSLREPIGPDATAEVDWKGGEPNPFYVADVIRPNGPRTGILAVAVGVRTERLTRPVTSAALHVTSGDASLLVPLVATRTTGATKTVRGQ